MNVLIIEDEKVAADRLHKMLREVNPKIEVRAKVGSVNESVKWLREHAVDLIFIDFQLSDGLSFSIFDEISISTPLIFTTAYDQYAIQALLNIVLQDFDSVKYNDPIIKPTLGNFLKNCSTGCETTAKIQALKNSNHESKS